MTTSSVDVGSSALRKVTLRFVPLIGLCYFVLYLDRLNVSVAALTMNKQLGIDPAEYGLIAGIFFWSYALLEVPSNYLLSRVGARVWVSRIIISWGVVTMATAAAAGQHSLLVLRLLLGAAEAGFSPAMLYFIASWFPVAKRGTTMSLMIISVPLSGVSTPISTHVLTGMDGLLGLAGWRWLFLVTGLPAIVLGFVFHRVIRNTPATATFLAPAERDWLTSELATGRENHPSHAFLRGFLNARIAVLVVVFTLFTFSLFGYQFFIPQILKQFGLGTNAVGWVAALPPVLAIGPMLWWARHSDRTGERVRHFAAAAAVATVGFLVAGLAIDRPAVAIVGFCLAGIGLYTCMPIQLAIPSTFLAGPALAAGLATVNGLGNIGGYLGPQITGVLRGATGNFLLAVLVLGAAILAACLLAMALDLRSRRRLPAAPAVAADTEPAGMST